MWYVILSLKVMLSLIVCTYVGVGVGNFIWDYNTKRMPTWFKVTLGLTAMAMFVSIFNLVIALIWCLPS